ncbi:hypothetical protein ACFFK0_10850 [Paenibacillus chartarius]|uniref:Cell division protein n=1 Tax=Paenibacillus chartarius TaxID=747481 RepID=A0ABV6DJW7_9BACL
MKIAPFYIMLPAILLGMLAMIAHGVTSLIWSQNISIWLITTMICAVYIIRSKKSGLQTSISQICMVIVLLLFTFWTSDLEGVHRWVSVGPINIHVASLLLPLLIINLYILAVNKQELLFMAVTMITIFLLLLQPDASQVSAFGCAAAALMLRTCKLRKGMILTLALIITAIVLAWMNLDHLGPVSYVEDILDLVADMGVIWLVLGVAAQILLLYPFAKYAKESPVFFAIGVYYLITLISTFFGHFPMPIMGYGISPIIGYSIAIAWIYKNKENIGVIRVL